MAKINCLKFHAFIIILLTISDLYAQTAFTVIYRDARNPNEPSLSVNPFDAAKIVVACNRDLVFHSYDSGKNWTKQVQQDWLGVFGDPVIRYTPRGSVLHAHLANNPKLRPYQSLDRIVVKRSMNDGVSWSDGFGAGYNGGRMQDKEWLSADGYYRSPYYGRIYLSWTEFDAYGSQLPKDRSRIRFSYSNSDGINFSQAITVSDTTGDCADGDNTLEGATTACNQKGDVFMVWAGHHKIWFDKSRDGGLTWGKDKAIAAQKSGWKIDLDNIYRANGMPFIAVQKSPKSGKEYICVVYTDSVAGFHQVFLTYSADNGNSWTVPQRINKTTHGGDQFFPNLTVNPESQELAIVYYTRGLFPGNFFITPVVTLIPDLEEFNELASLHHYPLIDGGFASLNKIFFGDYLDIAPYAKTFAAVWTQNIDDTLGICFGISEKDKKGISQTKPLAFGYDYQGKKFMLLSQESNLVVNDFVVVNEAGKRVKLSFKQIDNGVFEARYAKAKKQKYTIALSKEAKPSTSCQIR